MRKLKSFLVTFFVTFLVVCFSGMAEVDSNPVAEVMVGSSEIHFMPRVNYARLDVTLSRADGSVVQKTFNSGSTPYLDLSTIFGESSGDGYYTYELRVIPSIEVKVRKSDEPWDPNKGTLLQKPLTQTGHFLVKGGAIVTPSSIQETPARTLDVLHYDDVIITGSLCVGFDCADGESFGFDTIILKEHNLRIYFNDTSYTASYPTNSWRITINDSTNGGASYFSIDDVDDGTSIFKVEAGAPSNSLYVEDYGRVGLGTSTPVVELHIKDSDTPTLRLEQDSSGGWTAQTFDVAGNESNFFIRDATNGSKLPFRIQPSTPSSTLCLKADGRVGIGTWSPSYKFEIETTNEDAMLYLDRTDGAQFKLNVTTNQGQIGTQSSHKLNIVTGNVNRITVDTNGWVGISDTTPDYPLDMGTIAPDAYCTTGGVWHSASSRKHKENIRSLTAEEAVEALIGLEPVRFNYKVDKEDEYVGFISEDVPELVASKDRNAMSALDVVAVITKVVQEQQKTISELKKEIAELKKK